MNRVSSERAMKGWTQTKLANELRVDPSTVNRWEAGGSIPEKKLIEMRGLFNCDIDWLLGLSDERQAIKA